MSTSTNTASFWSPERASRDQQNRGIQSAPLHGADRALTPGTREVAELSAALKQMAVTLDQRARYIIAFAASVSHEFKTPLAGLRGAAELLEDHADTLSGDERARLLAVVSTSTQRLDQLVGRLLELARADMMRPGIAVSTSVASVLDELLPRYRAQGMNVDYAPDDEKVTLSADALAALFASLLDDRGGWVCRASVSASISGSSAVGFRYVPLPGRHAGRA